MTLDPHKWLYQPIECGSLLVREGELLERAFAIEQDYLRDAAGAATARSTSATSGCSSRAASARSKVWLSVSHFGVAAFRAAIDRRARPRRARARGGSPPTTRLETIAAGELGITCFRRRVDGDEDEAAAVNAALVAAYEATGGASCSSTRLDGRYAVRLCLLNHTTTAADVEALLDFFASAPLDPRAALERRSLAAHDGRRARAGCGPRAR